MQAGMRLNAISVSKNDKWIVCGTEEGASVWDGEMHEKFIDVESENKVWAVNVSPDSTRFATGTNDEASIWDMRTGERLVGPPQHDHSVIGNQVLPRWRAHRHCLQRLNLHF